MPIFPDASPRYVTATTGDTTVQPQVPTNTGLFGGCGLFGLFPPPPKYVGAAQPTNCPEGSFLFGASEPRYVQPTPAPVTRRLPESTSDKDKEKAR